MKFSINSTKVVAVFCTLFIVLLSSGCRAASLIVADNGKSTFSIVVPKVAASSVNDAATEMQLDIAEATGAKLPIIKDDQTVTGNFISLGSTKQAAAADISAVNIPDEGFRTVTKGDNLFIIGLDTTAIDLNRQAGKTYREDFNVERHPEIPGPELTKNGGTSQGTANGVYTFLQDKLNVRWLMPGDIGRDVPTTKTFQVAEMDHTEAPQFSLRKILYLQSGNDALMWRNHQRLGFSFRINSNASWKEVVPASLYKEHPNWFAMNSSGVRPDPKGDPDYKLETTNPELVEYVAEKAIEGLKAHPQLNTFSLSPTDSGGWSQSPESKQFMDAPHLPRPGAAVTRLVMKFYTDVSNIVAKEDPEGKLAGYLYGNYTYPPPEGGVKFPDNFIPMVVYQGNGYSLYQPDNDATAHIEEWSKYLPKTWFLYTHPLWLRSSNAVALVTPAAPETLNTMFATMLKYHCSGALVYGSPEWAASAMKDYIEAQMLWNPRADAKAIQHDWLMRAYGPQAGTIMEDFYNQMDAHWFSDYYRSGTGGQMMRAIYGAHYPQMEALLLKAWSQPMTAKQKERLGLIREQMIVLQWILRNNNYLPADYTSPLQADAKQIFQLLTAKHDDFQHFRNYAYYGGAKVTDVKVQLASPATSKPTEKSTSLPNSSSILLFPTKDGEVTIHPTDVDLERSIIFYAISDAKGRDLDKGLLFKGDDIVFNAKANEPYYLSFMTDGPGDSTVDWQISIPQSAAISQATFDDGVVNLHPAKAGAAPLYVYVPDQPSWKMETDDSGVVIHTPTAAQKNSTKDFIARKAAHSALDAAQNRYNAQVWVNLDYSWRFSTDPQQTGEKQGFEKVGFNDKSWKGMNAIGSWTDNGFNDYHGTAWYRKTFNPFKPGDEPLDLAGRKVLLFFGAVDGDAVFYLNGQKIGEHEMTDPSMSWQVPVVFDVTNIINADSNNTIAVKVTKDRLAAGLYKGADLLIGTLPKE